MQAANAAGNESRFVCWPSRAVLHGLQNEGRGVAIVAAHMSMRYLLASRRDHSPG